MLGIACLRSLAGGRRRSRQWVVAGVVVVAVAVGKGILGCSSVVVAFVVAGRVLL